MCWSILDCNLRSICLMSLAIFRCSMTHEVGVRNLTILDLPDHILENICNSFLKHEHEFFASREVRHNIMYGIPKEILNLRASCKQLREIVDGCPLKFSLSIYDEFLSCKELQTWLTFIMENSNWKVSALSISIHWDKSPHAKEICRHALFNQLMIDLHDLFRLRCLALQWIAFDPTDADSMLYLNTILNNVNTMWPSLEIYLQIYSVRNSNWESLETFVNVRRLDMAPLGDFKNESTLIGRRIVQLFPNIEWLNLRYSLTEMFTLKKLHRLTYLELESVQFNDSALAHLPSIKHLCFKLQSFESCVTLSEFLNKVFTGLEVLELVSYSSIPDAFSNMEPLRIKCHTVQITYDFLYLFAANENVENLGIDTMWPQEMESLLGIAADLHTLTFGLVANLRTALEDCVAPLLKRFKRLDFLLIRLADSEGEDFGSTPDPFLSESDELMANHPIKVLVVLSSDCPMRQFVYTKPAVTISDIHKFRNVARWVQYDSNDENFTIGDYQKYDGYYLCN